ncbi:LAMI_0D12684g1_1 [Lachancea mirantina]|uniref:Ubiquitin carboxyl-terminal hydrolase n=1 Tax=Lachancea mirantina TaxID=1230905 RepID=A0A1G4JFT8_9SACH|nr:LAMI_0D12684g1_1 [Lachancea mirantina]
MSIKKWLSRSEKPERKKNDREVSKGGGTPNGVGGDHTDGHTHDSFKISSANAAISSVESKFEAAKEVLLHGTQESGSDSTAQQQLLQKKRQGMPATIHEEVPADDVTDLSSSLHSWEELYETFPDIRPVMTDLMPFGDGSNKVFGYENFGNTCYCNSVLQCLYHLPELRVNILEQPERPSGVRRRRKFEMLGLKARVFDESSFASSNGSSGSNANNNNANGTSGSGTGSKNGKTNDSGHADADSSSSDTKKTSSNTLKEKEHRKSHSHAQHSGGFATAGQSAKRPQPIHATVMAADAITEKLHEGYTRIVVGRVPRQSSTQQQTTPSSEAANRSEYTTGSVNSAPEEKDKPNEPSSEKRKEAALIRGPILNVDHPLIDYLPKGSKPSMYSCLKDLFECIAENRAFTGVVSPIQFVETLKKENILFNTMMHQDAHEFLNFLLNDLSEFLQRGLGAPALPKDKQISDETIIDKLFKGTLTNRTQCLTCDNFTYRNEPFLDFPIEVQEHSETDIQEVLSDFRQKEMLNGSNKFYCDVCCSLQEAERVVGIRKLPYYLAVHLKRFKYSEKQNCNVKLFNKIRYPLYLKVCSMSNSSICKRYELVGVLVHMGGGPHHGHYVSLCKSPKFGWLLYDDETVETVDEKTVLKFIGDSDDLTTAYLLFYRDTGCEMSSTLRQSEHPELSRNAEELVKADEALRSIFPMNRASESAITSKAPLCDGSENAKSSSGSNKKISRIFSFKRSTKD